LSPRAKYATHLVPPHIPSLELRRLHNAAKETTQRVLPHF
jgi:hypothetical protein